MSGTWLVLSSLDATLHCVASVFSVFAHRQGFPFMVLLHACALLDNEADWRLCGLLGSCFLLRSSFVPPSFQAA